MKSTVSDLKKRGMADAEEIAAVSELTVEEQMGLLSAKQSGIRSAAAINLQRAVNDAASELLLCLSVEKCLYTKIAVCESLEKGNAQTAEKMTEYLGSIGSNQHQSLPDKVSAKKSFPLPRDIIARTLGRMDGTVLPVLMKVLQSREEQKISEVLDAIGFMVFYHPELASRDTMEKVLQVMETYSQDDRIVWKGILCLSAFPFEESLEVLERFTGRKDILGSEAERSVKMIKTKIKRGI